MKSNEMKRIQSYTSSSSDTTEMPRKSIDPSAEVAEPHLLLEENSFLPHSTIVKNDDHSKAIKAWKNEKQQSSVFSSKRKSIPHLPTRQTQPLSNANSLPPEQQTRRTVTFDDDSTTIGQSTSINRRLSNQDSIPNTQQGEVSVHTLHSSDTTGPINYTTEDLNKLLGGNEYIPGGFTNLDYELEDELLNDFADEFDDQTTRPHRYISSIRSSENLLQTTRSPVELWQRARILIALHLHQIETKAPHAHDDVFATPMVIDPSIVKINDVKSRTNESDYFERFFQQKENLDERKITFGLLIRQKFSLDSSLQYQCVDFLDIKQGYMIMCNVVNSDQNKSTNNKLLVYPIDKNSSNPMQPMEFDCPFQFHFMICIPIFRLILGFTNIKRGKSLLILLGDPSRKGLFLSKQDIPEHIYSVLYIHESAMLFLGCMSRVLLYNTQPLQYTSQPLFISELHQLPFQSIEPIIHLYHLNTHRSIGILSERNFLLWQYTPHQNLLMKFCNPYRYDFIRCHLNSKLNYIIFGFIDGFILLYQFNQMKQIRRYRNHWDKITDLKSSQDEKFLLSASIDQTINIWNLETLQHLYQYNTKEVIFQLDILQENLFYYRTLKNLILFQLNLPTLVFSITKKNILTFKLFQDNQRTTRILALLEDYSSILLSPVSGCCLTYVPNISKQPIKQVLHDISRSKIYSLQLSGEIILYHADNNPCVAEYKIQTKSNQYAITCMTIINPMRTHLVNIKTMQTPIGKSLENQAIFFGHTNGYISLFQGDSLTMEPLLAHKTSIICLETSRSSMETSNILFTYCEILLSSSLDGRIYLWDLTMNQSTESIELIHLLTIEQEKNISYQSIRYLSMIDNFLVANYIDQYYLHLWQLLNISIRINEQDQWGIVEHPTKGQHHHGQIQGISSTLKLKLFASSDTTGCIKIWDNTNSLLRDIHLDQTLGAIEYLPSNGELIFAYQNNIHLIFPENYLLHWNKFSNKQPLISMDNHAEDTRLEIHPSFNISYHSLPVFNYHLRTHHVKKSLQRFERQLAGRYAVSESDTSQSDPEVSPSVHPDHLSIISDDSNWSDLAEDVKDILRMKKHQIREEKK